MVINRDTTLRDLQEALDNANIDELTLRYVAKFDSWDASVKYTVRRKPEALSARRSIPGDAIAYVVRAARARVVFACECDAQAEVERNTARFEELERLDNAIRWQAEQEIRALATVGEVDAQSNTSSRNTAGAK